MATASGPHDPDRPIGEEDSTRQQDEPIGPDDRGRRAAGGTGETGIRDDDVGPTVPVATKRGGGTGLVRLLAIVLIVGGVILCLAGITTWLVVRDELAEQKITVAEDADNFAGDKVEGPLTAYAQAEIIDKHALEDTGGLTYAELPQDDPRRDTVMTASFLRASLFTSVVSFGVAAFSFGMGLLTIIIGLALLKVARELATRLAVP